MQTAIVILIVVACAAWIGFSAVKVFAPKKGGGCGGGCGCGHEKGNAGEKSVSEEKKPAGTVFLRSEDLVARVKARKG